MIRPDTAREASEWRGNGQGTRREFVDRMTMRTVGLRKRPASRDVRRRVAWNRCDQRCEHNDNRLHYCHLNSVHEARREANRSIPPISMDHRRIQSRLPDCLRSGSHRTGAAQMHRN